MGSPPLVFYHPAASAARGRIFPAPARENPAPRAISGPLTPVRCGQPRPSRSNELTSSADLTARCDTPFQAGALALALFAEETSNALTMTTWSRMKAPHQTATGL
jgi:hypothetical protein